MTPSPSSQEEARELKHLYLGDKTRCGQWLNPDVARTVSVREATCARCLRAYASEVEGDSDNPERVAAANGIYTQAALLDAARPTPALGDVDERVRSSIEELDYIAEHETTPVVVSQAATRAKEIIIALRAALDKNA
jgi:hypothetical protein